MLCYSGILICFAFCLFIFVNLFLMSSCSSRDKAGTTMFLFNSQSDSKAAMSKTHSYAGMILFWFKSQRTGLIIFI